MRNCTSYFRSIILLVVFLLLQKICFTQPLENLSKPDSSLAHQLLNQAEDFKSSANYKKAIPLFFKASKIYEKAQIWDMLVRCYNLGSFCHTKLVEFELSKENSQKSRMLLRKAKKISKEKLDEFDRESIENIYYYSQYFRYVDSFDLALEYLYKAIDLWSETPGNNIKDLALCQAQVGMIYYIKNDYEKSHQEFKLAIQIARKDEEKNRELIGNIFTMIGLIDALFGDFHAAIGTYHEGLKNLDKNAVGYNFSASIIYGNLSIAYLKVGDTNNALLYSKQSNKLLKSHFGAEDYHLGGSHLGLGNIYLRIGAYSEAKENYEKALSILDGSNTKTALKQIAQITNNLGIINEELGNFQEAIKKYREALKEKENLFGKNHYH